MPYKLTIGDLLHDRNPFEVPKYQRSYAWTENELEDFEEDATRLRENRQKGRPVSHFYGGLVSVAKTGQPNLPGRSFEVVDGQQRLATFLIVLKLVVDRLHKLAEEAKQKGDETVERQAESLAQELLTEFVQYKERLADGTREFRYRLTLSHADAEFFTELLDGKEPRSERDSHERLTQARKYLKRRLIDEELKSIEALGEKFSYLDTLQAALLNDGYVIHIVADAAEDAYQLFAVLNDRGRMLTDADLLRSLTLQLTESNKADQTAVASYWDEILAQDMEDADKFLRAYFPSRTGQRAPKFKMWHEFRDRWLGGADALHVLEFVKELEAHARIYRMLAEGEWPFPNPTAGLWDRDRLKRLVHSLKHDLAHPLLLVAAIKLRELEFSELVHLLERFAFRYKNMGGGHAGAASAEYYRAAIELREESFDLPTFRSRLSALVARSVPDDTFRQAIRTKLDYSKTAQRPNIKYFLTTLDDYLGSLRKGSASPAPDRSRVFDLSQVDIEHIYPQKPLPGYENSELDSVVDSIGNLTFWIASENRASQNAPFTEKAAMYQQSTSLLNQELGRQSRDWDFDAAQRRLDQLLDDACKVWSF